MKAEIEHGIDDKDTWWYRCPVCHDPLDYKQTICGWCYTVIEWDDGGKDGDGGMIGNLETVCVNCKNDYHEADGCKAEPCRTCCNGWKGENFTENHFEPK